MLAAISQKEKKAIVAIVTFWVTNVVFHLSVSSTIRFTGAIVGISLVIGVEVLLIIIGLLALFRLLPLWPAKGIVGVMPGILKLSTLLLVIGNMLILTIAVILCFGNFQD
jgi:hypothetical protein